MEHKDVLISVIVPVYKVEKYLSKCIDSILNQSFTNLEIILVDDGSPDNCGVICDEYEAKDPRIKVIHKANGGLSDARNKGLDTATGDFIGFVDSDDYINPGMYEALLGAISTNDADIAICNYSCVDAREEVDSKRLIDIPEECLTAREALGKLQCTDNAIYVPAWNKLYRKTLFDEVRFPAGKYHEDQFVVHELFVRARRIVTISDTFYSYLQHGGSIMSDSHDIRRLDEIEALINRYDFYINRKYYPEAAELMELIAYFYRTVMPGIRVSDEAGRKRKDEIKKLFEERYFAIEDNNTAYKKIRYRMLKAGAIARKVIDTFHK